MKKINKISIILIISCVLLTGAVFIMKSLQNNQNSVDDSFQNRLDVRRELLNFTYNNQRDFSNYMMAMSRDVDNDEERMKYDKWVAEFDSVEQCHDPMFRQIFLERRIMTFYNLHPAYFELMHVGSDDDNSKLDEYIRSEEFFQYCQYFFNLIDELDSQSDYLEGDFMDCFGFFEYYINTYPFLSEKFNISEDYFYNFIVDFANFSTKNAAVSNVLYRTAMNYSFRDDVEKARFFIDWLKTNYASSNYVTSGTADRISTMLDLSIGTEAPNFEVTTIDGNLLRLRDFRGRYVFLDFWGSWCGPCIGEISNNKKLANSIPEDQLKIIGLAQDDESELRLFLQETLLPYDNALVTEEIMNAYGIMAYPTTFLIDPQGKICAKWLRGDKLTELVQKEMGLTVSG